MSCRDWEDIIREAAAQGRIHFGKVELVDAH